MSWHYNTKASICATSPASTSPKKDSKDNGGGGGGGGGGFSAAFSKWLMAAIPAGLAETVTFPLDVTKTRLQLQNELGKSLIPGQPRLGMFGTASSLVRNEGVLAMYKGLSAALLRQVVYGGIGIGFYGPVRSFICGKDAENAAFWQRIAAGCLTGGFGQLVASPTDVVKVRLQADGRLVLLGEKPRYKGMADAFVKIYRNEGGMRGYYRGAVPSVQRAAVINGTGIAVYDHSKRMVSALVGTTEGLTSHILGALFSGLASALVSSPFDVIKTRLMNDKSGQRLYRGMLDCGVQTIKAEGVLALYKGFLPAYVRLAPWQMVFFIAYEQLSLFVHGKEAM